MAWNMKRSSSACEPKSSANNVDNRKPEPVPNDNPETTSAIPAPSDVNETSMQELTEGAEPQPDIGDTRASTSTLTDDQDTDNKNNGILAPGDLSQLAANELSEGPDPPPGAVATRGDTSGASNDQQKDKKINSQKSQHQQPAGVKSSTGSAVVVSQTASRSTVVQDRAPRRAASTQPAPRRSDRAPFSSHNTRKGENGDRAPKKSGKGKGSASIARGPCDKENVPPAGCGFCSGGAGCWRCMGTDAVAGTSAGGGLGLAGLGAFGAFGAFGAPSPPPPSGSPTMLAGLLTAERTSASSIWLPTFPTLPTGGAFGQRDRLPSRGSIPAPGVKSEDDAAEAEERRESRGKRQREEEEEEGEGIEERKRARRG